MTRPLWLFNTENTGGWRPRAAGKVTHYRTCFGKGSGPEGEGRSCRREKSEEKEEEGRRRRRRRRILGLVREEVHAGSDGEKVLAWGGEGHVECEVLVWPPGGGGHRQLMAAKLEEILGLEMGDGGVGGQPSEV